MERAGCTSYVFVNGSQEIEKVEIEAKVGSGPFNLGSREEPE